MVNSLEVLAWVIGLLRADSGIAEGGVSVFLGILDESLSTPYISVRHQSGTADSSLCGGISLEQITVQTSLWHHDLEAAAAIAKRIEAALQNARRLSTPSVSPALRCTRIGSGLLTEPAHQPPTRSPGIRTEGAGGVLHRIVALWRVTVQPDSGSGRTVI